MTTPADLVVDDRPCAPAIAAAAAVPLSVTDLLPQATTAGQRAAVAMVAGSGAPVPVAQLLPLLASDALDGRAAAWALRLQPCEDALIQMLATGSVDQRNNAWNGLAHRIAHAGDGPAEAIRTAAEEELARVAAGRAGVAEAAARVLVVLGDAGAGDYIQRVMDADRFCDRFELQRLRKLLDDDHARQGEQQELDGPMTAIFADELVLEEPVVDDEAEFEEGEELPVDPADTAAEDEASVEGEEAAASVIDWDGFVASEEAAQVPEEYRSLVAQLGPAFEQLAERALGKPLFECHEQEIAALFLQVLPQALPPQYIQVALSPQGLAGFAALAAYCERQLPGSGAGLSGGLQLVREQIKAQMRASGNLNSTIYDDQP